MTYAKYANGKSIGLTVLQWQDAQYECAFLRHFLSKSKMSMSKSKEFKNFTS